MMSDTEIIGEVPPQPELTAQQHIIRPTEV